MHRLKVPTNMKQFISQADKQAARLDTASHLHHLNIRFVDRANGIFGMTDGSQWPLGKIEGVVACFTPGTGIATPKGEVPVERLKKGDRVLTRDNGIQTIRWIGQKKLDHLQLKMLKELRPVLIKAGALGDGRPERDMMVSPMHRVLVHSDVAKRHFGESEVLVAAKDLLSLDGVSVEAVPYVTYVHFLCDHHEIVLANGGWSESFQPAELSLKGMDEAQREEIFGLFPELSGKAGTKSYRAARRTVKSKEVSVLFSG